MTKHEPKQRQTQFSVAEDDWVKSIPPPGHYEATVVDASIYEKSTIKYLSIKYSICHGDGRRFMPDEFLPLEADPQSAFYSQTALGKSRVKALMEANNGPLTFDTIHEVPNALKGCRAIIAVAHKNNDGLPVPVVRGIVGPADLVNEEPWDQGGAAQYGSAAPSLPRDGYYTTRIGLEIAHPYPAGHEGT